MSAIEPLEKAQRYADAAMARMAQEGVAPTPQHFAVWYAYHAGYAPELNRAVDILSTSNQPLTDETVQRLHDSYVGSRHSSAVVQEAETQIGDTLREVMEILSQASQGTDSFGRNLADFSGRLSGNIGGEQLREAVNRLAEQSREMSRRNGTLQRELEGSAHRMEELNRKLEQSQREARIDGLTNLANRRTFDEELRRMATEAIETGEPLCLAMTDIDFFKKFNDTHGHRFGDQVLRLVATALRANVKGRDLVARYGGEEFALLLPHTRLQDALRLCETIRQSVGSQRLVNRATNQTFGSVTLSLGLTAFEPGEPLDRFVQRADAALYAAKRSGRNKVVADSGSIAGADVVTLQAG